MTSGAAAPKPSASTPPVSTGSTWPAQGCRGSPRRGPGWARPSRQGRPRGGHQAHQARAPGAAAARDPDPVTGGLTVTGRFVPVGRAGVYVPGGLVAYPSSVVMNIVPAQVACVGAIAVASPPQARLGGLPHPSVLAACALLGVREVDAAGGAQALAMFAYGTSDCAAADVITGPGNVYVAAAKRVLRGVVGTDGEAGPTEVAIIADDTADPATSPPTWLRRPSTTSSPPACSSPPTPPWPERRGRAGQAGPGGQAPGAGGKGPGRPGRLRDRR